ncbi:UNVERIFIED_CONTAM: hypothetical protein Slati_4571200 [Sesamum latifolium]|uniref:Uncharacterized protein n=1 Tax=Sesamum latifolium TaxID=2727402 RepID=A0AAW2SGE0_9LAMI
MNEECRTKHKVTYWHLKDPNLTSLGLFQYYHLQDEVRQLDQEKSSSTNRIGQSSPRPGTRPVDPL